MIAYLGWMMQFVPEPILLPLLFVALGSLFMVLFKIIKLIWDCLPFV